MKPVVAIRNDPASERKARGAFFTPPELCTFVAEWAIRSPSDHVFEPSCGEAAFLLAAGKRLMELGAGGDLTDQLSGVEIHTASAQSARSALAGQGYGSTIVEGDFFSAQASPSDAVIGNPPYVRYQDFTGDARVRSRAAALAQGVRLSGLASSWASFVVHAATHLTRDGRMGLVLPGELLTVSYAAEVRSFLLRRFAKVRLVLFEERVFPDVSEEVVLLLAEGSGGVDHFEVYQATKAADLADLGEKFKVWRPADSEGKWLSSLIDPRAGDAFAALNDGRYSALSNWGTTGLGMVTGNNNYFCLSLAEVNRLGLSEHELLPISPPGSRHLRGLTLSDAAWRQLADRGSKCLLFYPSDDPSPEALRYIAQGEAADVHLAYKCRVRKPWYRVPLQSPHDLFVTYMNHDAPRLVSNEARLRMLNSVHGIRLHQGLKTMGRDLLPISVLNSATMLGAELVGRSYGGGLLKLEPKEADRLLVPSPTLIAAAADDLRAIRPQLGRHLRGGDLMDAVTLVDAVLLVRHAGLSEGDVRKLRAARNDLFDRRASRGGKGHSPT